MSELARTLCPPNPVLPSHFRIMAHLEKVCIANCGENKWPLLAEGDGSGASVVGSAHLP